MIELPSQLRRRILLAEDNPVNRQIVIELLEIRRHEVKLAGNGIGDAGMDGYLSKPIRAKELFDAIEQESRKEKFL